MGQVNTTQTTPIEQYPNNIKKTNFKNYLKENKSFSSQELQYLKYQQEQEAEEVFRVQRKDQDNDTKYNQKQQLIDVIKNLKDFQDEKGIALYKNDLKRYFKEAKSEDKIRKIIDFTRESYISERYSEKNKPIHDYVQQKLYKYNGNQDKTDEWGHKYTISDSLCLTLPALFVYDNEMQLYQLKGKLTNQFCEFPQMRELEEQISNLLSFFSDKLKITHECFKNTYYSDQLFSDTKKNVSFDKEIRAQVSIFEMELSPHQQYIGQLHKEGHSVESILYSCLYIPQQDQGLDDGVIEFSRLFEDSEINHDFLRYQLYNLKGKFSDNFRLPLGRVKLEEDLMIIFPNRNLHKVLIKNNSDQVQKRLVIQLSIVNHIDQPFTINDLDLEYNHEDELNEISYEIKKIYSNILNTTKNIKKFKKISDDVTFCN